ncbi:hypothetical protein FisN_6Lh264 [Fistulifera solaris]|uniref:Uncharacterized protein n=1 Tax=Fistulifera solaris TaxID=1519565 RepID=A0A1Z5J5U4_FISSO|nr:hypothetical protein FisN_6Lh264 [Fistulifera solaris]|eukprot:GAX09365.1 hypothetical protein FisN_6Lh264 [Fistulifera solaris]
MLRALGSRLLRCQLTFPTFHTSSPASVLSTCRSVSSSSPRNDEEPLFERGNEQFALIRTGLGFSSFHTAYWIWYTTDFVPAVNAANIPELYVDPMLGVTGTIFATGLQLIFFAWPKRLVSRLTFRPATEEQPAQFRIYTHTLLGVLPATKPAAIVPVASSMASLLNPSSPEAKEVLADYADQLSSYRGYLPIRHPKISWPPLMLDFRDSSNIPHPDRLLQALLNPKHFVAMGDEGRRQESRLKTVTKLRQKHQRRR